MFWCGSIILCYGSMLHCYVRIILCYGSIIHCYSDITHHYIGAIHGYTGYTTGLLTHNTQNNAGQFIFVSTGDAIFGRHKRGCQGALRCTVSSLPQPSAFNEDNVIVIGN